LAEQYLGRSLTAHDPVKVDPARGKRIAEAYEALPVKDEAARASYAKFAEEIEAQYRLVVESGVVKFDFTEGDPYPNSEAMRADIRDNHRLRVYTGGEDHPFLTREQNNRFRAVHDLFGHAMRGFQFGPSGEENAWMEHSKMFSREAQPAMTTETRGQNSWFNYSPDNEGKPPAARAFAVQKAALLPEEFWP
jgi:hypothetical protein